MVAHFYYDVQMLPQITDQEMSTAMQQLSVSQIGEFDTVSALKELYIYVTKYSDQVGVAMVALLTICMEIWQRMFKKAVNKRRQLLSVKRYTGLSKKMDGIWNRYNLKSTGRIYTFGILKYSEKFKVLGLT